ncbi:MAG: zinc-binding dehydrogenase [Candidatus Hodarchaeota archaeon]
MNATMRCLVIGKNEKVRLDQRSIPFPKDHSNSILQVLLAGICSTDLAVLDNQIPGPRPLIMGHEFIAKTVDDPSGRLCVSEINLTCGNCEYCTHGISSHCVHRTALGISADGAFAEFVKVPQENIHYLPPTITPEQGVFVEPLAAAVQSISIGKISPEKTVGVLGTGRLGLLQIQVLRAYGVTDLVAIGRSPEKLVLAEQLGALETRQLEKIGNQDLATFDVVIEATGSPNAMNTAIDLVKSRGTIVMKSTPGMPAQINLTEIVRREIAVLGSRCGPFKDAIKLLEEGKIQVEPLISAYFPLEEFREAFKVARQRSTIKVLFDIK